MRLLELNSFTRILRQDIDQQPQKLFTKDIDLFLPFVFAHCDLSGHNDTQLLNMIFSIVYI